LCRGPGHKSRTDHSLSVKLDPRAPDGFLCFSHAGDDWKLCRDHVRTLLGLPPWQPGDERNRIIPPSRVAQWDFAAIEAEVDEGQQPRSQDDITRIKLARTIWDEAVDPHGTAAEQYLRSRALVLADDVAGSVLRFHARTPWRNENTGKTDRIACLIAAFRSVDDNEICAVHRIRADQPTRWPKAERRMLGVIRRTAVKFDPAGGDTLHIGEGVETCLAARMLGHKPTWALGSVGAISYFPLITNVARLCVLGESGEASAEAIRVCGGRWHRAGRKVQVVMPSIGSDLNDEVMAATA
jgi:putative DNA primase/helicase